MTLTPTVQPVECIPKAEDPHTKVSFFSDAFNCNTKFTLWGRGATRIKRTGGHIKFISLDFLAAAMLTSPKVTAGLRICRVVPSAAEDWLSASAKRHFGT